MFEFKKNFISFVWFAIFTAISGYIGDFTNKTFNKNLPNMPYMNEAWVWLISWFGGLLTFILLLIIFKLYNMWFKNNKMKKRVKIIYALTKLDIVFRIQTNYSGDYSNTLVVNVENEENIKYQRGQIFRPLDKSEQKMIAVIFLEFEIPLEAIAINGYELNQIECNKGSIEILYAKYCNFENKNFITACCIALHGINETKNSSFRVQFLPSQ